MKKLQYFILTFLTMFAFGCEEFIDVNDNPNDPVDVQESLILPAAELTLSRNILSGVGSTMVQHFLQNMAQNQPIPQIGTYRSLNNELNDDWASVYTFGLNNLKQLNEKAESNSSFNYAAIAKILTALTLGTATDLWGDIPYSQALTGSNNFTPAYDSQESIYEEIQRLLDNAIADIGQNSIIKPSGDDFFYGGAMDKWEKLAYTLKARYYMHLTKAPGHTPAAQADLALSALANGMDSPEDALVYTYPGGAGQENRWYRHFDLVSTSIMASTFVNVLDTRNDPRLPLMVKPAEASGLYNGRVIGTPDIGVLNTYSYPSDFYIGTDASHYMVNYSEALFLKAEATLIKSGAAAAEPIYRDGITKHMELLGASTADINAYLGTRGALTNDSALQLIIEEKAVVNFLNVEAYVDWRRTGFPQITKVMNAQSEIPRRLLYPETEMISNPQPQHSAILTDRVWWDQPE
jgi:hypothetical protein